METIEKEIIQDADYNKYLEELKEFYNLKNKYTLQKNALKNKLFNSKDSIESKKKTFQNTILNVLIVIIQVVQFFTKIIKY